MLPGQGVCGRLGYYFYIFWLYLIGTGRFRGHNRCMATPQSSWHGSNTVSIYCMSGGPTSRFVSCVNTCPLVFGSLWLILCTCLFHKGGQNKTLYLLVNLIVLVLHITFFLSSLKINHYEDKEKKALRNRQVKTK